MRLMSFTSVPVKPETLRRLRHYKIAGASFDEVLNELMDDHAPETFLREHLRRLREEERVSWAKVKARHGL